MALIPIHRRVTYFWRAFFGGVFLFSAFAALVIIVYNATMPKETVEKGRADARVQKLAALRADDSAKLNNYAWANKQKGTVRIPIDRAMELVLVDLQKKTPHASNVKVENPYPAGLQDVVPAATPLLSGSGGPPAVAAPVAASPAPAAPPAPATPPPPVAPPAPATPPPAQTPPPASSTSAPKPLPASTPTIRQPLWNWESPAPASSPVLKQ